MCMYVCMYVIYIYVYVYVCVLYMYVCCKEWERSVRRGAARRRGK